LLGLLYRKPQVILVILLDIINQPCSLAVSSEGIELSMVVFPDDGPNTRGDDYLSKIRPNQAFIDYLGMEIGELNALESMTVRLYPLLFRIATPSMWGEECGGSRHIGGIEGEPVLDHVGWGLISTISRKRKASLETDHEKQPTHLCSEA